MRLQVDVAVAIIQELWVGDKSEAYGMNSYKFQVSVPW